MHLLIYPVHLLLLFYITFLFKKKVNNDPLERYFLPGILVKLTCGIVLGLIYLFWYHRVGDSFGMHDASASLTHILFEHPKEYLKIFFFNEFTEPSFAHTQLLQEPRVFFYVKFLSLLNCLTFSNYWINGLYLSFFSFAGSWILANTLVRLYNVNTSTVAISFLFLPSFVFWTSGMLKESFAIPILFIFIHYCLIFIHERKFKWVHVILAALLLYICWKIKFYYVLVTVPTLISYGIIKYAEAKIPLLKNPFVTVLSFSGIFTACAALAIWLIPSLSLQYIADIIYYSYQVIADYSASIGKKAFELEGMAPELGKIIENIPEALAAGLLRPFIWESSFNLMLLAGIENLVFLILLVSKVYGMTKFSQKMNTEVVAVLLYIVLTAAFMALIAPNWGTLSRYKSSYLCFWCLMLCSNNPLLVFLERKFGKKTTK